MSGEGKESVGRFPLVDFPAGQARVVKVGKRSVLVVLEGETVTAVSNRCPHQETPFGVSAHERGFDNRGRLVCPLHNWVFDLESGMAAGHPGVCLRRYRAAVSGNELEIDISG